MHFVNFNFLSDYQAWDHSCLRRCLKKIINSWDLSFDLIVFISNNFYSIEICITMRIIHIQECRTVFLYTQSDIQLIRQATPSFLSTQNLPKLPHTPAYLNQYLWIYSYSLLCHSNTLTKRLKEFLSIYSKAETLRTFRTQIATPLCVAYYKLIS